MVIVLVLRTRETQRVRETDDGYRQQAERVHPSIHPSVRLSSSQARNAGRKKKKKKKKYKKVESAEQRGRNQTNFFNCGVISPDVILLERIDRLAWLTWQYNILTGLSLSLSLSYSQEGDRWMCIAVVLFRRPSAREAKANKKVFLFGSG